MENLSRDPAEERPEPCDIESRKVLVIGCGNVFMGDDGLGPAVIKHLSEKSGLSGEAGLIDAGTGVRKILFNIVLSERKPKKIIVVDAVDVGKTPGEIFEIELDDIPPKKSDDFSMHQLPTSNMLKELKDECGVDVRVLAVQVGSIPEEIKPGLSRPVAEAVSKTAAIITGIVNT